MQWTTTTISPPPARMVAAVPEIAIPTSLLPHALGRCRLHQPGSRSCDPSYGEMPKPTTGALSACPPIEPRKFAPPYVKIPSSAATVQ
jgi:hypothetical protein